MADGQTDTERVLAFFARAIMKRTIAEVTATMLGTIHPDDRAKVERGVDTYAATLAEAVQQLAAILDPQPSMTLCANCMHPEHRHVGICMDTWPSPSAPGKVLECMCRQFVEPSPLGRSLDVMSK